MTSERRLSSKEAFRSRCRQYRASLTERDYVRLSSLIVDRALRSGEFDAAAIVHVYWPITSRREVDTRPLVDVLVASGKQVVVPSVFSGTAEGKMTYRSFSGGDRMQKNRWGTHEPVPSETAPPEHLDLVVAPALGADRLGHRLGYGGGFYDRFLKETDCAVVSLVYSECLFDAIPHEPHDISVDLIVTEEGLVRPG